MKRRISFESNLFNQSFLFLKLLASNLEMLLPQQDAYLAVEPMTKELVQTM
jgi:hypothetical protein